MEGTLTLFLTSTPQPIKREGKPTLYQAEFRTSMDKDGDTFSNFIEEDQYKQLENADFGAKVLVKPVFRKDYRTQKMQLNGFSSLKVESRQPVGSK